MKRKKIVATMAALLAVCLVLGAGGFRLMNREQEPRLDVISRKDALEDYDYLWETLEGNYPFFGVAERKYRLDIQQLKQDYRRQLESMGKEIDFLEFYQLMKDCIGKFRSLGHLTLYSAYQFDNEIAMIKPFTEESRSLKWRMEYISENKKLQERYQFLRDHEPEKWNEQPQSERLIFDHFKKDIAYIAIKTFAGQYAQQDKGKILDFFLENKDSPYLIIDITGNGGGASAYWIENIVSPNITERKSGKYFYVSPGGERSNQQMEVDGIGPSTLNRDMERIQQLPKVCLDDLEKNKYWGEEEFCFVEPKSNEKIYNGQIFLLIDEGTGSAADTFALFCKEAGFATVLGQGNARGSGPGCNYIIDQLPHSNLLFRYRPVLALDMEGAALEEFGVAPDVLLPSRAKNSNNKISPLAACLNYIEELEERKD